MVIVTRLHRQIDFARLHIDAGDAYKSACVCERWLLPSAAGCTSSLYAHHAPKSQTVHTVARHGPRS